MFTKSDMEFLDTLLDRKLDQKLDQKLAPIKRDLAELKQDTTILKENIQEANKMLVNLFDWSQEIHENIVQEKLPERVRHLEDLAKTS